MEHGDVRNPTQVREVFKDFADVADEMPAKANDTHRAGAVLCGVEVARDDVVPECRKGAAGDAAAFKSKKYLHLTVSL